jgi:hypothetical protein
VNFRRQKWHIQDICFRECTEKRSELDRTLPIVPVGSFSQDSLFSPEQIYCYIGSVKKKLLNGEEDEKI